VITAVVFLGLAFAAGVFVGRVSAGRPVFKLRARKWENVTGGVWFPADGQWLMGNVHCPTDATRQYYKVYAVNEGRMYRVATIDLHRGGEVEHQPAPAMSTVELEDEMQAEETP
jgi:hypothetical protein